jgi:hypothetical protein
MMGEDADEEEEEADPVYAPSHPERGRRLNGGNNAGGAGLSNLRGGSRRLAAAAYDGDDDAAFEMRPAEPSAGAAAAGAAYTGVAAEDEDEEGEYMYVRPREGHPSDDDDMYTDEEVSDGGGGDDDDEVMIIEDSICVRCRLHRGASQSTRKDFEMKGESLVCDGCEVLPGGETPAFEMYCHESCLTPVEKQHMDTHEKRSGCAGTAAPRRGCRRRSGRG